MTVLFVGYGDVCTQSMWMTYIWSIIVPKWVLLLLLLLLDNVLLNVIVAWWLWSHTHICRVLLRTSNMQYVCSISSHRTQFPLSVVVPAVGASPRCYRIRMPQKLWIRGTKVLCCMYAAFWPHCLLHAGRCLHRIRFLEGRGGGCHRCLVGFCLARRHDV